MSAPIDRPHVPAPVFYLKGQAPIEHIGHNSYDGATEQNLYWCQCAPDVYLSKRKWLKHLQENRQSGSDSSLML